MLKNTKRKNKMEEAQTKVFEDLFDLVSRHRLLDAYQAIVRVMLYLEDVVKEDVSEVLNKVMFEIKRESEQNRESFYKIMEKISTHKIKIE